MLDYLCLQTMREEPIFKKCCCCVPLKTCLQVWVIAKIIADLALSLILISFVVIFFDCLREDGFETFTILHAGVLVSILLLVDLVFMVALGIALVKNSVKTVKVFFYYSICMMIIIALVLTTFYIYALPMSIEFQIGFPICVILYLGLDVCIALTTHSEMIKLRNKEQYDFLRMPTYKTNSENPQGLEEVNIY